MRDPITRFWKNARTAIKDIGRGDAISAKVALDLCETAKTILSKCTDHLLYDEISGVFNFFSAYAYSKTGTPAYVAESSRQPVDKQLHAIIVVGLGGAGGNAINNMIASRLRGVSYVAANTDAQDLEKSFADTKVQLGAKLTRGLGAGANPEVGRIAALESYEQIKSHLDKADLVFIAAGMGGGTGTGSAPVIAKAARESGALVVAVVTKPFYFEGQRRTRQADDGISTLTKEVDAIITIHNDRLLQMAHKKAGFGTMLKMADEVLYNGVKSITDLILSQGLINLDFADIRTILSSSGQAFMGTGAANGHDRANTAVMMALNSPLMDEKPISGAARILYNISCSDITTDEINRISHIINKEACPDAQIIFGVVPGVADNGRLQVSVITTDYKHTILTNTYIKAYISSANESITICEPTDSLTSKQHKALAPSHQPLARNPDLQFLGGDFLVPPYLLRH